jgi:hypothetical protein
MSVRQGPNHSINTSNLADLLERVLDKGVVIAGDIKVSLVDIELLSIQIRLVICSVDKAREMGMDWWANSPVFSSKAEPKALPEAAAFEERIAKLEAQLKEAQAVRQVPPAA